MSSCAFVAAAACLLFAAPTFSKADAEAAVTSKEASSILNNFLHDSKHFVFANQKEGVLPTAAHLAFNSLLTTATTGNLVTTAQQSIVQQLSNVIQLLAKQGPTQVLASFVNQTNTMIETQLKSNVRRGLANLSALVNNSFTQGYQQCDTSYTAAVSPTGTVMSLTQAFVPLVPDYQSCRATESTFQNSMTQAANLAASMSATQVSKCAIFSALDSSTLNCPTRTGENASAYALRMSGFFQQQNSNWTFLRSDCSSATIAASTQNGTSQAAASSWSTQKTTCDSKQDAMDAASCNVFTASVTACQNYQTCYTQFATSFQAYQQGYNSQLGGLISQWASLLQMQCLLNGVVNSSNSQNCSNQVLLTAQATQSLPLYYPSPLAAPSCTSAVGYAGTPTYVQNVYSVLPANAPAKFCVASCCPTTTTTTTRVALISGSMSFNLPTASASQLRSALPAALAASLGVTASQVSVSVSGSSSPYAVTYFVSAPLTSQSSIQASINGFSTPATATTLQTNLASQLAVAGATVASSAVSVSGVSTPSSSTVGSQTLPNLASAVAVSAGSLTLNLGSVTGSTSTVQAAALNALSAYFGTSQVMTNVTLVRSTPLTFNVSYNVSFPIGSLPRLQTLSTGATSSALQTSLTTALSSSGVSTSSLSLQNFVAPVAGLVPASSVVIVATTTATTTTATTTTATATTTTLTTTTTKKLDSNNAGCYRITDAKTCCDSIDGRTDQWGKQKCVPARQFSTFSSGFVCEPQSWVTNYGRMTLAQSNQLLADCGLPSLPKSLESNNAGCYLITDAKTCCDSVDGRTDRWGKQKCVPAPQGSTFSSGYVCEPQSWVTEFGGMTVAQSNQLIANCGITYPTWVTYTGTGSFTYSVAASTCSDLGGSLCSRAQYCINGKINSGISGKENGQVSAAADKWAPYSDVANGWIHTSTTGWDQCVDHILDSRIGSAPGWGTTGSSYGTTMCCALPFAYTFVGEGWCRSVQEAAANNQASLCATNHAIGGDVRGRLAASKTYTCSKFNAEGYADPMTKAQAAAICDADPQCQGFTTGSSRSQAFWRTNIRLNSNVVSSGFETGLQCFRKAAPTCPEPSSSITDLGYNDLYRGWYDTTGCGRCRDYCRWVGNSGSGGYPAIQTTSGSSEWACVQAGTTNQNTPRGYFGSAFYFTRCTEKNAIAPAKPTCKVAITSLITDWGYGDSFRGWYDTTGCGLCVDYCRWVGNSGAGGDPRVKTTHGSSFWSCALAGSSNQYTNQGALGTTFNFKKCGGQASVAQWLGCFSYNNWGAPLGWAAYSTAANSDTLYYSGARLSGSYDSIVSQCTAVCFSSNPKYTHIAIHDNTACFCGITDPTSSATGAADRSCTQNSVYGIRAQAR